MTDIVLLHATWIARRPPPDEHAEALRTSPTWSFRTLDAGHWPMLTAPEEVTALLDEIARRCS